MKIIKCSEFLVEARVSKDEVKDALIDMFKKKPNVEMESLPNERGMYSLAGMKKHLSQYKPMDVGNALGSIQNDKEEDLNVIYVNISVFREKLPYWSIGLDKEKITKLKDAYEREESIKNKSEVDKREESKKAATKANTEKVAAKKTTKKDTAEKAERKPGAPKKATTRARKK